MRLTPLSVAVITEVCLHISQNHVPLQWRHNDHDVVSKHQLHDCLLNRLFKAQIKETSKLRVITGLCAGNSPLTAEFPAQMASNAENVSIWWRHHALGIFLLRLYAPVPLLRILSANQYELAFVAHRTAPYWFELIRISSQAITNVLKSGLSVDIFCWGSEAPTIWISKGPKQNLKGPSIEIYYQFSNFGGSIGPSGKILQGHHWIFRGPGPLPPGPREPWKCSKHPYWPCESKPIRIASYCIAEHRINSCQFRLFRISSLYIRIDSLYIRIDSLYIRIDSLYIRTGIHRLSAATQYVAIRCATIALSYWIAHTCSLWFV